MRESKNINAVFKCKQVQLNLNKVDIAILDTLYQNNYAYATKKFMYSKSYSAVVYECMSKTD